MRTIKMLLALGIILLITPSDLFSQQPEKSFSIWDYKPAFGNNFLYKNLSVSESDFKYTPEVRASWVDVTVYSAPKSFYQLDLAVFRLKYFKIGLWSMFPSEENIDLKFILPIGFELPWLTFKRFSLSFGSDLYWWPIDINDDSNKKYYRPRFIDSRLRLENNNLVRFSALAGYRMPLNNTNLHGSTSDRIVYSTDISGFYVGLSFALGQKRMENNGLDAWESARVKRTGYDEFIAKYPRTPYSNQKILARVAISDPDQKNRLAALKSLSDDQSLLLKIAKEDGDPSLRLTALGRIRDQSILNTFAINDPVFSVRAEAVSRITDQSILNKIALGDNHPTVRKTAVGRITDQTVLLTVAIKDSAEVVRFDAAKKITDQVLLGRLILEGPDEELNIKAVERITDQSELLRIALNTSVWTVRYVAFNRLDKTSLEEFEKSTTDPAAVIAARIRQGKTTWKEQFNTGSLGNLVGATALVITPAPAPSDVVKVCHDFIAKGDESRIPELKNLLFRFGDISLAEDYLNCGQAELKAAGEQWARSKGLNVNSGHGSNRVRWGEKK